MQTIDLAKRRARGRRRESGAALFIVAMTLAVLASVGMYALASASNEVRTSGNERQNTETHFLSQYGVLAASEELAATKAQFYLGLMLSPSTSDQNCLSLQGVPPTADPMTRACRRVGATELAIGSNWASTPTDAYTGAVPYGATPGSLGQTPVKADFFVEFTAPTMANAPARYALGLQFCFIQFTATSTGITQPQVQTGAVMTPYFGGEGLEAQRARLVAGPVQCPR
ncbi:MAG: hypothetical protein ABSC94_02010 [Polyangiaceae bacterium]|jgi:hypothetical protein